MTSTILLLLSLLLACLFGSSNQAWSWGPALLALAGALLVSAFERAPARPADRPRRSLLFAVLPCAVYLAVRAVKSPVWEFALADLLVIGAVLGSYLLGMHVARSGRWLNLFFTGLGAIVLLNFAVALVQLGDPEFSVLGLQRLTRFPTGLFTQYSYFANFMIGCGCLLSAVALLRRDHYLLRSLWGLAAAAAFASVWLSKSRGSLVGLAFGGAILLLLLLPIMRRRSKNAFAVVVVAFPLLLIAGGFATNKLMMSTQEARGGKPTVEDLSINNTKRFHFLAVALEGAGDHPWLGGGSQAFRWECRRNWDVKNWGMMDKDPDYVHNEFMQALTDYGIVGVGLLLLVLVILLVPGFAAVFVSPEKGREASDRQAVIAGALAGLIGMLCQASFSFVFHTLPSALLMGLLAGLVAGNCGPLKSAGRGALAGMPARLLSIALGVALVPPALRGARTLEVFLQRTENVEARLWKAAGLWPASEFHLALGHYLFSKFRTADSDKLRRRSGEKAATAYAAALERNPFEPEAAVNRARVLSLLGRNAESENEFHRAIDLQGAFEAGFKAHHYYAEHLYRLGASFSRERSLREAKMRMGQARAQLAKSGELCHDGYFPPGVAHGFRLKTWRADDYLTGVLAYEDGYELWQQRKPEEALALFQHADEVLGKIRTPDNRRPAADSEEAKLLAEVRRMIKFLEGAGIRPAGEPETE